MGAQISVACQDGCEEDICAPECCVAAHHLHLKGQAFEHFDLRTEPNYLHAESHLDDEGLRAVAGKFADPHIGVFGVPSSQTASRRSQRPAPLDFDGGDVRKGSRSGSTPLSTRSGASGSNSHRRTTSGDSGDMRRGDCLGSTPLSARSGASGLCSRRRTMSGDSSRTPPSREDSWRQGAALEEEPPDSPLRSSRSWQGSRNTQSQLSGERSHGGLGNARSRRREFTEGCAVKDNSGRQPFTVSPSSQGPLSPAALILSSTPRKLRSREAVAKEEEAKPLDIRWSTSDAKHRVKFSEHERLAAAIAPVRIWSNYVLQEPDVDVDIYIEGVPEGGAISIGVALRKQRASREEPGAHLGRCDGSIGFLLFSGSMCDIEKHGKKVQLSVCAGVQKGSTVTIRWDGHARTVQFMVNHGLLGSPLAVPNGDYVFAASLKEKSALRITQVSMVKHR